MAIDWEGGTIDWKWLVIGFFAMIFITLAVLSFNAIEMFDMKENLDTIAEDVCKSLKWDADVSLFIENSTHYGFSCMDFVANESYMTSELEYYDYWYPKR